MRNPIEKLLSVVIEPQISPFRGPLFFARIQETASGSIVNVVDQGGFGLVDTGKKKLLITCSHVLDGFLMAKKKDADLGLHLCLNLQQKRVLLFDERHPIAEDKSLDIVVFDMEPLKTLCEGLQFYPLHQKPPPPLVKGSRIVVLGNQGIHRSGLEFGLTHYALEVSDVGQDGARFLARMAGLKTRQIQPPARPKEDTPHSGISGSPCFLVAANGVCSLVGFASEVSLPQGIPSNGGLELLQCTHANCLNEDGTIKKR
jgi:hypothetical protein